jgi:hypothetical protein
MTHHREKITMQGGEGKERMKKIFWVITVLICACSSAFADTRANSTATIKNIPEQFNGGIILITGGTDENEKLFRYSPKVLQRITGTSMNIKLYTSVSAIQVPFTGTGDYLVIIQLYTPGSPTETTIYKTKRYFVNGSTTVDLSSSEKPHGL